MRFSAFKGQRKLLEKEERFCVGAGACSSTEGWSPVRLIVVVTCGEAYANPINTVVCTGDSSNQTSEKVKLMLSLHGHAFAGKQVVGVKVHLKAPIVFVLLRLSLSFALYCVPTFELR